MTDSKILSRGLLAALSLLAADGSLAATPPAQIAVSPSKFELQLGPRPTTESATVMNLADEPVTIEVDVASWDLDDDSRVRIVAPNEQSLDAWMVVHPLRFTIPARESQTVRFSIRPRVALEPGEHRAMIYFNQVLPPGAPDAVRIKFSFGVAVYASVGEVSRIGELHDATILAGTNPIVVRLDVSSHGSAHVRLAGRYAIFGADAYTTAAATSDAASADAAVVSGVLPSRPVLPATRRQLLIPTERELPAGRYVLDLSGDLTGAPIHVAIPFRIGAPELIADTEAQTAP